MFDERRVVYDYGDLNELGLAWSISIHKSQGSEYPVVILPLYMQHYLLLSRNLIYTGLTRAKQLAIAYFDPAQHKSLAPQAIVVGSGGAAVYSFAGAVEGLGQCVSPNELDLSVN
jgi:hypothetical protein